MKFDILTYLKSRGIGYQKTFKEAICTCVWCHREKHLYVNVKNGNYVCFRCGEHGRKLLGLVAKIENCSLSEAARFIQRNEPEPRRNLQPIELRERISALRQKKTVDAASYVEVPEEFVPVFDSGEWLYPTYLKDRGISRETARDFGVGFCEKGRYMNRIVLPYVCPNGSGFTARDVTGYAKQKYLNAGGVNRRSLFYGWRDENIGGDLVLCEGPFDVLKLYEHGVAALGLLGKTLSRGQYSLLTRFPIDTAITVMLDPETRLEPLNIVKTLSNRFDEIYFAQLPEGIDPGDATSEQVSDALDQSEKIDDPRLKISRKKMFHMKRRFEELNSEG